MTAYLHMIYRLKEIIMISNKNDNKNYKNKIKHHLRNRRSKLHQKCKRER